MKLNCKFLQEIFESICINPCSFFQIHQKDDKIIFSVFYGEIVYISCNVVCIELEDLDFNITVHSSTLDKIKILLSIASPTDSLEITTIDDGNIVTVCLETEKVSYKITTDNYYSMSMYPPTFDIEPSLEIETNELRNMFEICSRDIGETHNIITLLENRLSCEVSDNSVECSTTLIKNNNNTGPFLEPSVVLINNTCIKYLIDFLKRSPNEICNIFIYKEMPFIVQIGDYYIYCVHIV